MHSLSPVFQTVVYLCFMPEYRLSCPTTLVSTGQSEPKKPVYARPFVSVGLEWEEAARPLLALPWRERGVMVYDVELGIDHSWTLWAMGGPVVPS